MWCFVRSLVLVLFSIAASQSDVPSRAHGQSSARLNKACVGEVCDDVGAVLMQVSTRIAPAADRQMQPQKTSRSAVKKGPAFVEANASRIAPSVKKANETTEEDLSMNERINMELRSVLVPEEGSPKAKKTAKQAAAGETNGLPVSPFSTNKSVNPYPLKPDDIWNKSIPWVSIREWHPAGVIANTRDGVVHWAKVSYLDLYVLTMFSFVGYPVFLLMGLLCCTFWTSMSMRCEGELPHTRNYLPGIDPDGYVPTANAVQDGEQDRRWCRIPGLGQDANVPEGGFGPLDIVDGSGPPAPFAPDFAPPILSRQSLTPMSQWIYDWWVHFCACIPVFCVFGLPVLLMSCSYQYPEEISSILVLVSSAAVFFNSCYMIMFSGYALTGVEEKMASFDNKEPQSARNTTGVRHWVIVPMYQEDLDVLSMAIQSIADSSLAVSSISVVLAMEQREDGWQEKAAELRSRFRGKFADVIITGHPPGLPNDPPGKASNLKWAFNGLLNHLCKTGQSLSNILLTVSDADSEFHHEYFAQLTKQYMDHPPDSRDFHIYQSQIFHVKNYYRQPGIVIVGTMFTTMQELSLSGDPDAVRFAYSSYSLSLELARRVGGWDAEWIAEDWHMTIKCFLLTAGLCTVEPLLLPTINYTPETESYFGSVYARWSQAKRHALGISDLAYYFMMIPLIFGYASAHKGATLKAFWSMTINGLAMIFRLVNVHVILAIITTYGALNFVLEVIMRLCIPHDHRVTGFFTRTAFCINMLFMAAIFFGISVTVWFVKVHNLIKNRIEPAKEGCTWMYCHPIVHWLYTAGCFCIFGPVYFFALAACVWRASIKMMLEPQFEYEVAAKPKPVKMEQNDVNFMSARKKI